MSCVQWSLLLVAICIGFAYGDSSDLRTIDSIDIEQPCSSEGGMCTIAEDCPEGTLAKRGLCPKQENMGVECCYGISRKETRCAKHGGMCVNQSERKCKPRLVYSGPNDCSTGELCCIIIT